MNDFSIFKVIAAIGLVTGSCAVLTSLSGCGPTPGSDAAPSPAEIIQTPDLKRSFELASEAEVTCADAANCLENVGMLVSANEDGVARCTGSLIAPDLVLTANRCVPPALRGDASCSERIRFLLPAMVSRSPALPAQQSRCARVLETGPIHALIRLETPVTDRAPLELDFKGVKDNIVVRVMAVSPVSNSKPFGELRMHRCIAKQNTVPFPGFRSDESAAVAFSGCRINETGAGAPALSGLGASRAVIGDALSPKAVAELQARYRDMLGDSLVHELVGAANLACIAFPSESGIKQTPIPAACMTPAPEAAQLHNASLIAPETMEAARLELQKRISKWQGARSAEFAWKQPVLGQKLSQDFQPMPVCISNSSAWLDRYKHWYRRGGYDSKAEIDFKVPRYRLKFIMNSTYQTQYTIQDLEPASMTLRFSPKQIAKEKQALVRWWIGSAVLPLCQ